MFTFFLLVNLSFASAAVQPGPVAIPTFLNGTRDADAAPLSVLDLLALVNGTRDEVKFEKYLK